MNAMWHPNDVIRWVILPHIRFNCHMTLANDNTPCYADRSTYVILLTNTVEHLIGLHMDLNPSKHVWDILKRNVRASHCNQLSGSSRGLLTRFAILQQFLHIYHIRGTMYIAIIVTAGGHTMNWNEVRYDLYWYCSFCFRVSLLTLSVKCDPVIKM